MTGAIHLAFRFSARLAFCLCAKRRVNLVSWHRCLGTGAVFRHSCLGTHFEHCATPAVGVPKLQLSLCTAAAAAPLLEGVSEERPESPVHAPLPVSVMVHASAEIEHPIVVAANLSASIADPGAAIEAQLRASSGTKKRAKIRPLVAAALSPLCSGTWRDFWFNTQSTPLSKRNKTPSLSSEEGRRR